MDAQGFEIRKGCPVLRISLGAGLQFKWITKQRVDKQN